MVQELQLKRNNKHVRLSRIDVLRNVITYLYYHLRHEGEEAGIEGVVQIRLTDEERNVLVPARIAEVRQLIEDLENDEAYRDLTEQHLLL